MNEFMKSRGMCLWRCTYQEGSTSAFPKRFCLPMVSIDQQSLSGIRHFVWRAALAKRFFFCSGCHDGTWHQSLRNCPHRLFTVSGRRMVPPLFNSAQSFVLHVPKYLDRQTHRNTIEPTFSATHQRKSSSIILLMLKHYSYRSLRFWARGRLCISHCLVSKL